MSAALKVPDLSKPPDIEVTGSLHDEAADLRHFARSPHPYARHGSGVDHGDEQSKHDDDAGVDRDDADRSASTSEDDAHATRRRSTPGTGSESGTEADDERPTFVKALPAPLLKPRKGWKGGKSEDGSLTPLLTPSQLEDEGTRLSNAVFKLSDAATLEEREKAEEDTQAVQERLYRRRLAEFLRRISEVALLGVIVASVLFGTGVWKEVRQHHQAELLTHVLIVITLVLAYPLRLSFLGNGTQDLKAWQRFRVPASFDPATILYPTFLPVLVALSVLPANSAVLLPNVVLGLSSLPQRLFPRASRFGGINTLHWFVTILPLIADGIIISWPSKRLWDTDTILASGSDLHLHAETIATLYPLHQALLPPLHFLTTTSLLSTELQLLSTTLVNLLLFATSPQASILSICLWVGGVTLFVLSQDVLHWNVTLARVPKWKLRRPGHAHSKDDDTLVATLRAVLAMKPPGLLYASKPNVAESDADDDERLERVDSPLDDDNPLNMKPTGVPMARLQHSVTEEPRFVTEPRQASLERTDGRTETPSTRRRRNTLPDMITPQLQARRRSKSSRGTSRPRRSLWCLDMTPAQANARKWLYAGIVFATIITIVLGPIRYLVSKRALRDNEPIGWALGYLFGDLPQFRDLVDFYPLLGNWIPLPSLAKGSFDLSIILTEGINAFRWDVGPANTRLLLFAYWAIVLVLGLLAVFSLTAHVEVDTRRKVFHAVMVAMLLPATFIDPCFCALALALVLAVFLLLEVIRAGQVPPLGNAIGRFVAPYVDGRDLRGPVVVSHIFLLIGCAVPLWFSLAAIQRAGSAPWSGWELVDDTREVAMVAGVICVGMGDAAASLFGRRFGRHKWIWIGGKSLEGSAAFAIAVTIGLMATKAWLTLGGWRDGGQQVRGSLLGWSATLAKAVFCGCGASFMEAVLTGANDNVVVPVALWLLVKGVRV